MIVPIFKISSLYETFTSVQIYIWGICNEINLNKNAPFKIKNNFTCICVNWLCESGLFSPHVRSVWLWGRTKVVYPATKHLSEEVPSQSSHALSTTKTPHQPHLTLPQGSGCKLNMQILPVQTSWGTDVQIMTLLLFSLCLWSLCMLYMYSGWIPPPPPPPTPLSAA